jgi:aspartate/methionine/tyrosine aminotransferase
MAGAWRHSKIEKVRYSSVNYARYRQFRDELLRKRQPLRLDCMNPVRALASWTSSMPELEQTAAGCSAEAIAAWSRATQIALDPERAVVGRGVRNLLSATFSVAINRGEELWLPEDVYPVYWELGRQAEASMRAFATLPQPNLSFLSETGEGASIVFPVPVSPLGRLPTDSEANALIRWLSGSRRRLLILDAVYTFDFNAGRPLMESFLTKNGDQCILLWSCSKSWLAPGSLGLAAVPRRLAPALQGSVSPLTEAEFGKIKALLDGRPDLGQLQQAAFNREWQRLAPRIRCAVPDWKPPSIGYFSVVSMPFTTLLDQHDILSVPASVFGSAHDDLAIVTCLHDLAAHEKGPCAS